MAGTPYLLKKAYTLMITCDSVLELKSRVSQSIIGQEHMVERLILGLLANGNLLLEGLPGLCQDPGG